MCQCTLFDVGGVEIHSIEYCTKDQSNVKDVEDRSNTPKKVMLCMSEMSKIDQIHLRAVMLCMSKMSKIGKEHTHTFWLITSLILNGFSIRKKFWKAET